MRNRELELELQIAMCTVTEEPLNGEAECHSRVPFCMAASESNPLQHRHPQVTRSRPSSQSHLFLHYLHRIQCTQRAASTFSTTSSTALTIYTQIAGRGRQVSHITWLPETRLLLLLLLPPLLLLPLDHSLTHPSPSIGLSAIVMSHSS